MPSAKLAKSKKVELDKLRSLVAHELLHKRELQTQPKIADTFRKPGPLGVGHEGEGEGGYSSDPGSRSHSSFQDQSQARVDPQSFAIFESRIERLEKHCEQRVRAVEKENYLLEKENYLLRKKVELLESTNRALRNTLAEKDSYIEQLENTIRSQKRELDTIEQKYSDQVDDLRKKVDMIEQALQNRQVATPPTTTSPSAEVNEICDQQPQCSPWQFWKRKACNIIWTGTPNEKSSRTIHCYDTNCGWGNTVSLNAYILHLKRKPHFINVKYNPDQKFLPRV